MNPRVAGAALGLLVTLLIGMLIVSTLVEGAERWRPLMIGAGSVIAVISLVLLAVMLRSLSRTARGEDAEAEFERTVLKELTGPTPAAPPQPTTPSALPTPRENTGLRAPTPGAGASPSPAGHDALLAQLRLARLDPLHEGELSQGPLAGTLLLRLGRDETAAVMARVPAAEDWPLLFPRFDRVFYPVAEGKWACAERMEAFIRDRIDLTL